MRHGSDPGAQQMGRGMDRAARQDGLLAAEFLRPARDDGLDADAAVTIEDQLRDLVSVEMDKFSRILVAGSR